MGSSSERVVAGSTRPDIDRLFDPSQEDAAVSALAQVPRLLNDCHVFRRLLIQAHDLEFGNLAVFLGVLAPEVRSILLEVSHFLNGVNTDDGDILRACLHKTSNDRLQEFEALISFMVHPRCPDWKWSSGPQAAEPTPAVLPWD